MKHYCSNCGKELDTFQFVCPSCFYCEFTDKFEEGATKATTLLTAQQLECNTQWVKYKCGPNGLCGHGYAAEDLNAFHDYISGSDVEFTGRDNSLYGADRTVDGVQIQTKYCVTPKASIDAGFPNSNSGNYAYWDAETGKPQLLEVPSDQYDKCVALMREKIKEGKVVDANGNKITNPDEATNIIKKGNYTYQQAKNVTKAGNIDSLKFDFETGIITACSAFGISFAINLCMTLLSRDKNGLSLEEAIKLSYLEGLKSGTISMSSHIATSQVLKTSAGRYLAAYATKGSKEIVDFVWQTDAGKKLIQQVATNILQKNVNGGAAKQVVVKFLRTNAVAQLAMFVVTSIPDTWDLLRGRISGKQFTKNLVVSGTSLVGATVGGMLASKYGGWAALGGAVVGGGTVGWASKKVADFIHKDDSERMQKIVKAAIVELSNDYLIQTEEEFDFCMKMIKSEGAINPDLFKCMYSAGKTDDGEDDFLRASIVYNSLEYYFGATARNRKTLHLNKNQTTIDKYVESLVVDIEEASSQLIENNYTE